MYMPVRQVNTARKGFCLTSFTGAVGSEIRETLFDKSWSRLGKLPQTMKYGTRPVMVLFIVDNFTDEVKWPGAGSKVFGSSSVHFHERRVQSWDVMFLSAGKLAKGF
jgi:hypothetical protein